MTTGGVWRPFEALVEDPWAAARQWKGRSGKVVAHLLPDVPEEIVHAAGALSIAVEGAGVRINRARAHLPGNTCAHATGLLEMGLDGRLDMVDGLIIPYVCDTTRNLIHAWHHLFPDTPGELLRLPKRIEHPGAPAYLEAELRRLAAALSRLTGVIIDEAGLRRSIRIYNRSRALLRRAYRLHRRRPLQWTAVRLHALLAAGVRMPPEEYLDLLTGLPWEERGSGSDGEGIPIYLRGKLWDPPEIPRLLDETGFVIAGDELVTGWRMIAQDASSTGDPFRALAVRHLNRIPYPGYHAAPGRAVEGFVARVQDSGARGVLFLMPKFCEAAGFELPDLQRGLREKGVPYLTLETGTPGGSLGQIRVRLEAFAEMIGAGLP
jgi:benzoyl-CoA reductase subunit C